MLSKRTALAIAVLLAVFAAGLFVYGSVASPDHAQDQERSNRDAWTSPNKNTEEESGDEIMKSTHPPFKVGHISMSSGPLLRSLLERVWVTKYFGEASEILTLSSDMPLCEALPSSSERDQKSGAFLWRHPCLPISIQLVPSNGDDLGGIAIVRMLDFAKSAEVIDDVFEVIRTDSLGAYKLEDEDLEVVLTMIKKELASRNLKAEYGYDIFLRTYPTLEGRYFLDEKLIGSRYATNEPEYIREYFSKRGKKYTLEIQYNSNSYKKDGNIIEYSLTLPAGFFGMEDDFRKGNVR